MAMKEPALPRMLLEAFRALDREIDESLNDRGMPELRPSQAMAMLLIDRTGTRLTELAERGRVSKQAMMQIVDSLAAQGCVRRVADAEDARAKVVKLTAKGLRQRAEARRALAAVEARARRRLGDRRYDALRLTLEELATAEE